MRNIKILLCIILAMLILACQGCGFLGDQKYVCEIENVETIQIVRLGRFNEEIRDYEYKIISEVKDKEEFIKRLNAIKCNKYWGDPTILDEGSTVIKIVYKNGDFDLLHYRAQEFTQSKHSSSGFFFFDKDQFLALISDYLPEK